MSSAGSSNPWRYPCRWGVIIFQYDNAVMSRYNYSTAQVIAEKMRKSVWILSLFWSMGKWRYFFSRFQN